VRSRLCARDAAGALVRLARIVPYVRTVLETLQGYVSERGYVMPLDLGSKGTCQIGGNIATNAGGLRFLRYGSLHGTVLGLEAVLADGTVLDGLSTLRKDNTGYDLKQLFIGSEGTLGVVTACALALPRASSSVQLAFLGLDSFDAVLRAFSAARRDLGEVLSAVEFLDRASMEIVVSRGGERDPLKRSCPFYLLVELSGSNRTHDEEKLSAFLEAVVDDGIVLDGTIAMDSTQAKAFWRVREGITPSLAQSGAVYKYDVSLPLPGEYSRYRSIVCAVSIVSVVSMDSKASLLKQYSTIRWPRPCQHIVLALRTKGDLLSSEGTRL